MNRAISILILFLAGAAWPQNSDPNTFAPFEQWKSTVLSGDAAGLKALYSADPPALVRINSATRDVDADVNFWITLKPRSVKVDVVRNELRHGHISYIFRA